MFHLPTRPCAAGHLAALCATILFMAAPQRASADDGHGHGEATAPAASGPALPRFAAVSKTFELVGVLQGAQFTLYLDRFADNSPVDGAQIQLDVGGTRLQADRHGEGVYQTTLAEPPHEGALDIQATVVVAGLTEPLTAQLDIHGAEHAHGTASTHPWKRFAIWAVAGLLTAGLAWWVGRRIAATRGRTGSAA